MKPEIIIDVLRLAHIVLQLSRVNRVTRHEDGTTLESDTDHTVMLALIAGAVACEFDDTLDVGLVVTYAVVHDLVEYLHGDTDTLGGLSAEARASKEAREGLALEQLRVLTLGLPWVHRMIERYERKEDREAVFVYVLDKVMPKITHGLNRGVVPIERGYDEDRMRSEHTAQLAGLRSRCGDQAVAFDLFEVASEMALLSAFQLPRDTMAEGGVDKPVPVYWRRSEIVAGLEERLVGRLSAAPGSHDRFFEDFFAVAKSYTPPDRVPGLITLDVEHVFVRAPDGSRRELSPAPSVALNDDGSLVEADRAALQRWVSECRVGSAEVCRVEEPPPTPGRGDVWRMLIDAETDPHLRALWESSRSYGIGKYGTPLQLGNGRDHLTDAIQEAADGFVYANAADMEAIVSEAPNSVRAHLLIAVQSFRDAAGHLLRAQRKLRGEES